MPILDVELLYDPTPSLATISQPIFFLRKKPTYLCYIFSGHNNEYYNKVETCYLHDPFWTRAVGNSNLIINVIK